eukprot:scaffold249425_cov40-Tisochrysis_lutea.AAC.2
MRALRLHDSVSRVCMSRRGIWDLLGLPPHRLATNILETLQAARSCTMLGVPRADAIPPECSNGYSRQDTSMLCACIRVMMGLGPRV